LSEKEKTNRLIAEKSPYLLQYAHNPVDWYPWGDEAIDKARAENKPIFLSIGYSTCHWCHVQNEESFENEQIAALMNKDFVSIKVDREERPDLDEIYMKSVIAINGQGGWPLSVFLTPDLKPFYGGTYYPPAPRHGLPGFPQLLDFISDLWKNKRDEIAKNSDEIMEHLAHNYSLQARDSLPGSILDGAYAQMVSNLDDQYGGFSGAPKFPLPTYHEFLLRYYSRTGKEPALRAVKKTLESMASGGIHDQVGGGFHRYSTDRYWLVPHFEKMLYDNALLARVYLEAHQVSGEAALLDTAVDTLEWMLREMRGPQGAFYSAQDADTPDGEGYYYTWTPKETEQVLGKERSRIIDELLGVVPEGNFEGGRSILHVSDSLESVASKFGLDLDKVKEIVRESKAKLLEARQNRTRPSVDDKVISSWNGLAISALACAYQVTGERRYLVAAAKAADFILAMLVVAGKVFRRYRDGAVAVEGTLEDYSFLAAGLLDLYEAGFDPSYLREAIRLADKMSETFWDPKEGGFFMSSAPDVLVKVKEGYDGPTPSGNAVAALTLLRISEFTGRQDFREKAEGTLKVFGDSMESSPFSHTYMLCALDFWFGSKEVVVAGSMTEKVAEEMVREIQRRFLPNKVLALADDGVSEISSLTEGKTKIDGEPAVYICENFACKSPVTQLEALKKQLGP
jgi:uncharacterized protein YyaL (SSP411 family)